MLAFCAASVAADSATQTESLEVQLSQSPYVEELTSIADEMTRRAIDRQVTFEELSRAYQDQDELAIAELLGYSQVEIQDLSYRLEYLRECLYAEFPEIVAWAEAQAQHETCDEAFLAHLYNCIDFDNQIYLAKPPAGTSCAWVPYTASLALCTALGPVLYWACATVAMCTYCSGGLVDTICGKKPKRD